MFKRGDTFNLTTTLGISAAGPGIIGAYGSGDRPIINATTAAIRIGSNDWRLMDLNIELVVAEPGHFVVVVEDRINASTLLRLKMTRFPTNLYTGHFSSRTVMQDSEMVNPTEYTGGRLGWFGAGGINPTIGGIGNSNYAAMLGNNFALRGTGTGNHSIRTQGVNYAIISNNKFLGDFDTSAIVYRGHSRYGVVSDNYLEYLETEVHLLGIFGISAESGNAYEIQRDIIVERNFFYRTYLGIEGTDLTIRNNIFRGFEGRETQFGAVHMRYISTVPIPRPVNINIYNNTVRGYSTAPFPVPVLFSGGDSVSTTNIDIRNNIVYAPSTAQPYLIQPGAATVTQSNNTIDTTNADIRTRNPLFTNTTGSLSLASDFSLPAGSYGVNSGVPTTGVLSDFALNPRPTSGVDMGAYQR